MKPIPVKVSHWDLELVCHPSMTSMTPFLRAPLMGLLVLPGFLVFLVGWTKPGTRPPSSHSAGPEQDASPVGRPSVGAGVHIGGQEQKGKFPNH